MIKPSIAVETFVTLLDCEQFVKTILENGPHSRFRFPQCLGKVSLGHLKGKTHSV